MKKMFVLLLSIFVLAFSSVSAGAYSSPSLNGSTVDSSSNSSTNTTATSPKTGDNGVYAVLMVAAAVVFGGIAIGAKKKLSD